MVCCGLSHFLCEFVVLFYGFICFYFRYAIQRAKSLA